MKQYKINFWYIPLPKEKQFIESDTAFLTSAVFTETTSDNIDSFHIKLNDIGLNSKHGDFTITRKDGLWQTCDIDGTELNFLKTNISWTLEFLS
ncbi:hypothetical protein [Winogradskyella pulchriflava]|uniref:Uncharacterized protein n=1 Tax=Winogradskyella pulchriflava TaxID=1110688 RepID=A0ABV6QA77_9FLAO